MDDKCQLNAKIDEDGLAASLIVPADFDRAKLTPELCQAMLMRAGIELSASSAELLAAFIEKAKASHGTFQAVAAKGTLPNHGEDAYVEWTIDKQKAEQEQAEQAEADVGTKTPADPSIQQTTSHYDRSVFTIVKTGDELGVVHHATSGQDGRSVTGKNLAAREGKALDFKHDESIMIGKGNKILAQADGVLDRSGNTICIRDTIEVDEYVDFNTGNITFNGNVVIQKGIRDCFKVQADGDVEVRGLIEAANIITGGELRALGGFAGREQGTAQVAGDLKAKYLDAVTTNVRGNLNVDREVINCNNTVLGQIDSPRGAIIGGETLVAGSVDISEIGSEGMPLTTLQVGVVPHLDPLIVKLRELTDKLVLERDKLVSEQEMIQKTTGNRTTATHKERLCELMYEIAEVQTQLDRAEPSFEKVTEKADSMRSVDVRVQKKVHPNTVLICSGMKYRVKNELKGPLRIYQDLKGRLQYEREGDQPQMLSKASDLAEAA